MSIHESLHLNLLKGFVISFYLESISLRVCKTAGVNVPNFHQMPQVSKRTKDLIQVSLQNAYSVPCIVLNSRPDIGNMEIRIKWLLVFKEFIISRVNRHVHNYVEPT